MAPPDADPDTDRSRPPPPLPHAAGRADPAGRTDRRGPVAMGWAAAGAAALLVAAGLFGFRDNLFRELIEPSVPFQVYRPPPAPDYADAPAWAARPQTGAVSATGATASAHSGVAVFFIAPTTAYDGRAAGWNGDPREPVARRRLETVVLPNHAAPFAVAGPLWVPRYRQAVLFAMVASREDTWDALDLAYRDIDRAFSAFLAGRPAGAPFVLAGSGQGGLHAVRLLQQRIVGQPAGRALVAAYVIDQPVPLDQLAPDGPLAGLPLCSTPRQTGCLVTYAEVDTGDTAGARLWRDRSLGWSAAAGYARLGSRRYACVNPLTGGQGASAPASSNPGSVAASGLEPGVEPPLLPGETGARCADGLLQVDPDRQPALRPRRADFGARYTTPGFNLFYQALAEDARTRSLAWRSRPAGPPPR